MANLLSSFTLAFLGLFPFHFIHPEQPLHKTAFDRAYQVTLDICVRDDVYYVSLRDPNDFNDFEFALYRKSKHHKIEFYNIDRGYINIINPIRPKKSKKLPEALNK